MAQRYYPHVRVRRISPNQSSRNGQDIKLIVIHATAGHNRPGVSDLRNLGDWFANPASQVSSHVATDNEGNSARYVIDRRKAWHCAAYNGVSLGIEQVIPGDGTEITRDLYRETARWIAYWSKQHGIPIRQGRTAFGRVLRSGVVTHKSLGAPGGNHNDPGPGYDLGDLLKLARFYASKTR